MDALSERHIHEALKKVIAGEEKIVASDTGLHDVINSMLESSHLPNTKGKKTPARCVVTTCTTPNNKTSSRFTCPSPLSLAQAKNPDLHTDFTFPVYLDIFS